MGISGVLFAVVLELGLRLNPNQMVAYLPQRFDETIGYVPAETDNGFWAGACFRVAGIHINEQGFRSPLPSKEKKGLRIAVFGDSFMEALMVPEGKIFRDQLAKDTGAEVLNYGRTGSGVTYAYALWRLLAKQTKPDVVILANLMHNDLMDDDTPEGWTEEQMNTERAYVRLRDGKPVLTKPVDQPDKDRRNALFKFYLPRFLVYAWGRVVDKWFSHPVEASGKQAWYGRPVYEELGVYREPKEEWVRRYDNEVALMASFAKEVEAEGGHFSVMMVPGVIEQLPDARKFVETLVPGPVPPDWNADQAQERLQGRYRDQGVNVLNLVPAFKNKPQEVKGDTPKYALPCDGHWTAEGHELAAREATKWLKEQGWLGQ